MKKQAAAFTGAIFVSLARLHSRPGTKHALGLDRTCSSAERQAAQDAICSFGEADSQHTELEFQIRNAGGSWSRVSLRLCQAEPDDRGESLFTIGTLTNSPPLPNPGNDLQHMVGQKQRAILHASPLGIGVVVERQLREVNEAMRTITG